MKSQSDTKNGALPAVIDPRSIELSFSLDVHCLFNAGSTATNTRDTVLEGFGANRETGEMGAESEFL